MADVNEKEGRRPFKDPLTETVYYIVSPTAEDVRGADWNYSKIYTRCVVEGIMTVAEMQDILRKRGITGPIFEERQQELTDNITKATLNLQGARDLDEKRIYALQVATARQELFQWNQRLNGPMSNTCENIADEARLEYLTSRMVEKEDGKKLWDSYDSFFKERSNALAVRSRFEVMLYLQGLDSDFFEQTPEAKAMREVEVELKARATEALEELRKESEEPDKSDTVVEEEKAKRKVGRKKE
jgi:hypothetical protein